MIQILTLSPAKDVTYELSKLSLGSSNRVSQVHVRPGGKGANVARVLTTLGARARLVCPVGGATGQWFKEIIESSGVECVIVPIAEETRTCIAAVTSGQVTELIEPAPRLTLRNLRDLAEKLQRSSTTVVTGSFPEDIEEAAAEELFQRARELTETLIVDTSGPVLRIATRFADYISPNWQEACDLAGSPEPERVTQTVGRARALISRGPEGVILTGDNAVNVRGPEQSGNPTGAGDALVAGFSWALESGLSHPLKYAVSVAGASVQSPVAGEVDLDLARSILDTVEESSYDARSN